MIMNIYSDFKKVKSVEEDTIEKYLDLLPEELINVWRELGYGTFVNGYLKIINPEDYLPLINETFLRSKGTIPILTTSMGDVILVEKEDDGKFHIIQLNYRKGKSKVIASKYNLFLNFLQELAFKEKALDWQPYPLAVKLYGEPAYDECFGYSPFLGLGGSEKVENLKKVKLREHVMIITEFMGPIQ